MTRPTPLYDSQRRATTLSRLGELLHDWRLVLVFARRVLLTRHRQTVLGILWAILQATSVGVLAALVLRDVVSVHVPGEGSYLLIVLGGAVAWTYVARATSLATTSIIEDGALLNRVYFPREVLPLSRVLAGLADFGIGLLAFMIVATVAGHGPELAWLLLPLPIALLTLAVLAVSLAASGLMVELRDFGYAIPLLLQVGFFACPVLYPLSDTPGGLGSLWGVINPVAGGIDALRTIVLAGRAPDFLDFGLSFGLAAVGAVVSLLMLIRLEPNLADML